MSREFLNIFMHLHGDIKRLSQIATPQWQCTFMQNNFVVEIDAVPLCGEFDNRVVLLRGQIAPDKLNLWLLPLTTFLTDTHIDQYQVELFEEDGRLIKRLQGGT